MIKNIDVMILKNANIHFFFLNDIWFFLIKKSLIKTWAFDKGYYELIVSLISWLKVYLTKNKN